MKYQDLLNNSKNPKMAYIAYEVRKLTRTAKGKDFELLCQAVEKADKGNRYDLSILEKAQCVVNEWNNIRRTKNRKHMRIDYLASCCWYR